MLADDLPYVSGVVESGDVCFLDSKTHPLRNGPLHDPSTGQPTDPLSCSTARGQTDSLLPRPTGVAIIEFSLEEPVQRATTLPSPFNEILGQAEKPGAGSAALWEKCKCGRSGDGDG